MNRREIIKAGMAIPFIIAIPVVPVLNAEPLLTEKIHAQMISIIRNHIGELNDAETWLSVQKQLDKFMNALLLDKQIYRYSVVCDETNNSPAIVDANDLVLDVYFSEQYTPKTWWIRRSLKEGKCIGVDI